MERLTEHYTEDEVHRHDQPEGQIMMSTLRLAIVVIPAIGAPPPALQKPIRNYAAGTDMDSNPISCHDGSITRVGDTFCLTMKKRV